MDSLLIDPDVAVVDALRKLGEGGQRCLVVVGPDRLLIGTLSDGDIRRAILAVYVVSPFGTTSTTI
jgi:CBS domain-containing protein